MDKEVFNQTLAPQEAFDRRTISVLGDLLGITFNPSSVDNAIKKTAPKPIKDRT